MAKKPVQQQLVELERHWQSILDQKQAEFSSLRSDLTSSASHLIFSSFRRASELVRILDQMEKSGKLSLLETIGLNSIRAHVHSLEAQIEKSPFC